MLRIRIVALPKVDEVDELDLRRRFRVGEMYELPIQLAATLIIAGYAESAAKGVRAEAADMERRGRRQFNF
jgi:hypothetical protein